MVLETRLPIRVERRELRMLLWTSKTYHRKGRLYRVSSTVPLRQAGTTAPQRANVVPCIL